MKRKVIALIAVVVIIVLIIGAIVIWKNNNSGLVLNLYNGLIKSGQYEFEMNNNDGYDVLIAKKDEQTSINMNIGDEKTTTLVKEGVTYLIMHQQEEYIVYNSDISEENIVTDMFKELAESSYSKGKEKINGKQYKYEEFQGFAGFMISTSKDLDESDAKTRIYFDGNEIKYIKTITDSGEELLQVRVVYDVDDSLFEIPENYAEAE
jgi:flagellar basal body-associated protein FliL